MKGKKIFILYIDWVNDFDENISEEDNNEIKKNNNIIGLNNEKDLNHEIYENEWNDDSY